MADTSLIIGNGNWAVKETSLLGYNIIQNKYVPIEMTVSRNSTATTATRVKSGGLIELVPKNLFSYSQTFDNTAGWTPYPSPPLVPTVALIVIPNVLATSAPNGTFTADKLVAAATSSEHILIGTTLGANVGTTYTVSVFAKAAELSRIQFLDNAGSGATANFILSGSGTATPAGSTTITPVGNDGWYRCTMTYIPFLPAGALTGSFNIHIKLLNSSGAINFLGNDVDGVYLWGAQLEFGPTATEYFPTTDRFNIPRVDYSTGTASLLVEPARTNLLLYSEEFDNAYWSRSSTTITSNNTTAPDGTTTADRLVLTGTSSTARAISRNSSITTVTTTVTFSTFVKYIDKQYLQLTFGSGFSVDFANFDLINGMLVGGTLNAKIENYANGWYRISITSTGLSTTTCQAYIWVIDSAAALRAADSTSTGTSAYWIWGAQLEDGSNATSYIPTLAAIGIRAADVISKTGISSLIGQTEGTLFVEANLTANTAERRIITVSNGTETQRIIFWTLATTLYISINTATSINLGNFPIGPAKIAFAYTITPGSPGSTTYSAKVNTDPLITATLGVAPTPLTNINLGSSPGGSLFLNDRIKSVQLYKTALSPGQLATLTA
jgi:hypothetical protein